MTIEEARSSLEREIIFWGGIIGIGVINENNHPVIEIAIDRNEVAVSQKLNKLINQNQWQGYNVKVTPTDGFKLQKKHNE